MIIPCEVAAKSVVPAIRASIAKELLEKHNMKQNQVAHILGISQSAVSKYSNKTRGQAVEIGEVEVIKPLIDKVVDFLLDKRYSRTKTLKLFCQTCVVIRGQGLMCDLCRRTEPTMELEKCDFCLPQPISKGNI